MPELTSMKNIGREMARKLAAVGIDTPEKLLASGSRQAFLKLKAVWPQVCLVHLYALEGAIQDVEFNRLSAEKKAELKEFSDFLRGKPARKSRRTAPAPGAPGSGDAGP